jgi:hypothetical protein
MDPGAARLTPLVRDDAALPFEAMPQKREARRLPGAPLFVTGCGPDQPLRVTAGAGFSGWAQPAAKPASMTTAAMLRTIFFMRVILDESSRRMRAY